MHLHGVDIVRQPLCWVGAEMKTASSAAVLQTGPLVFQSGLG